MLQVGDTLDGLLLETRLGDAGLGVLFAARGRGRVKSFVYAIELAPALVDSERDALTWALRKTVGREHDAMLRASVFHAGADYVAVIAPRPQGLLLSELLAHADFSVSPEALSLFAGWTARGAAFCLNVARASRSQRGLGPVVSPATVFLGAHGEIQLLGFTLARTPTVAADWARTVAAVPTKPETLPEGLSRLLKHCTARVQPGFDEILRVAGDAEPRDRRAATQAWADEVSRRLPAGTQRRPPDERGEVIDLVDSAADKAAAPAAPNPWEELEGLYDAKRATRPEALPPLYRDPNFLVLMLAVATWATLLWVLRQLA